MKIKINDVVKVNTGKDKGKSGKVQKVITKTNQVVVEGLNIYKKHVKKSAGGGIIDRIFPIYASKVNLVCPKCSQATRVGLTGGSDGKKIRVCRKCKQPI